MWKEEKVSLNKKNTLARYFPGQCTWKVETHEFQTVVNTKEW